MQHSVLEIGKMYSELSIKRKEDPQFNVDKFLKFAIENKQKYNIITYGNDGLVSTWYSDTLINDYQKTLKNGN